MSTKITAYVRTSTVDQTLEQQTAAIRAAYPEGTEIEVYHEQLSGWGNNRRPEYEGLKQAIQKGRVKEICVANVARLGRNVQEAAVLLTLCQQRSVRVRVLSENLDFSGPFGFALFTLFAALAQMDSDTKSQNTRAKLAWKKEVEGWQCHGSPPHTFSQKVKEKAAEVYRMLDEGKSQKYIARMLGISQHSVGKVVKRRGFPLLTRQEFARCFPGWHQWSAERLDGLTLPEVLERYKEVFGCEV